MNSSTLTESGFIQWCPIKTLSISNLPIDKTSVFVIIDQSLSGKAGSDILYIGRSKKPIQRILGGYLAGYGGKNTRKISQKLLTEGYLEKTAICVLPTDKPRVMQQALLAKFAEEQGEYPSWNVKKKMPKKIKSKLEVKTNTTSKATASAKSKTAPKPKTPVKVKPLNKATAVAEKSKAATKTTMESTPQEKPKAKSEDTATAANSP
jgi:hypothetical protein